MRAFEGGETVYTAYSSQAGKISVIDNTTAGARFSLIGLGPLSLRVNADGTVTYTHTDHLGTPVAASDGAGTLLWKESYLPFGEKRFDPEANRDKPGFTGHIDDDATGLTYMQARYYDPVLGRFLSTDPVGYQDQLNLYAYVGNDPVNTTDPNGEFANVVFGALIGIAVEGIVIAAEGGDPFDVGANLGRYGGAALIGGVSSGVGAFAAKGAANLASKTVLREIGRLANGIVGKAAEGAVGGGVAAGTALVVDSALHGEIPNAGDIGTAAENGAIVGGIAGAAQKALTNAGASASGRGPVTKESTFHTSGSGMTNGIQTGKEGVALGVLGGTAAEIGGGAVLKVVVSGRGCGESPDGCR